MTFACIKLKTTLPNVVIRGGSRMSAIPKMEFFGNNFTLKDINFCCRELDPRQTLAYNLDPRSSSKI